MEYKYLNGTAYKRDYTYDQLKRGLTKYVMSAQRFSTFLKLLKMKRLVLRAFIESENINSFLQFQHIYSYDLPIFDFKIHLDLAIDEIIKHKSLYEVKNYNYEDFSEIHTFDKIKRTVPEESLMFFTPITEPIVIAPLFGRPTVIDGNHRLFKLISEKTIVIPAYVLTVEQTAELLPDKFSILINSFFAIN
jgi:hypothetical protein